MYILCEIGYRLGYLLFGGVLITIACMAEKCAFIQTIVGVVSPLGFSLIVTAILVASLLMIIYCGAIVDPDD
jgi:hypothetical protein